MYQKNPKGLSGSIFPLEQTAALLSVFAALGASSFLARASSGSSGDAWPSRRGAFFASGSRKNILGRRTPHCARPVTRLGWRKAALAFRGSEGRRENFSRIETMKATRFVSTGMCGLNFFLFLTVTAPCAWAAGIVPRPDHVVIVIEE